MKFVGATPCQIHESDPRSSKLCLPSAGTVGRLRSESANLAVRPHGGVTRVPYCVPQSIFYRSKCGLETLKRAGDTPSQFHECALYTPTRRCYLFKRDKELGF